MTPTSAQIDSALDSASADVRELIEDGALAHEVVTSGKKNNLHIDQVGIVASLARNMLLGLVSPTQFVAELKETGVTHQSANAILQDLNEKIFKPLFETIKTSSAKNPMESKNAPLVSVPAVSVKPVPPTTPQAPLSVKAPSLPVVAVPHVPAISPVKPASPAPAKTLPTLIVPKPPVVSAPPVVPRPTLIVPKPPAPPQNIAVQKPSAVPSIPKIEVAPSQPTNAFMPMPKIRTMATDVRSMNASAVSQKPTLPVQPSNPVAPRPSVAAFTPVAPKPIPPYVPPPVFVPPAPKAPATSPTGTPSADELSHSLKEYGVDPYREAIG